MATYQLHIPGKSEREAAAVCARLSVKFFPKRAARDDARTYLANSRVDQSVTWDPEGSIAMQSNCLESSTHSNNHLVSAPNCQKEEKKKENKK